MPNQFALILIISIVSAVVAQDKGLTTQKEIKMDIYTGSISINVQNAEKVTMQYSIAIKPSLEDCPAGKCFLGWVQFYTVQGETIIGYQNP